MRGHSACSKANEVDTNSLPPYTPGMQIKTPYPIDEILPELKDALREHSAAVVSAPPGSGKTTRIPLALLEMINPEQGRILVLEPRRMAAVCAARWMAQTLGEEIGRTLGYSIRFDSRVSKATRIEVMTEGILTRRILAQPDLKGVALVIFDEFHERSLQADLALAMCLDIRRALRDDLKILVMSATLETGPVCALLGGAPVISGQGQAYPVQVRYSGDSPDRPVVPRMTGVIQQALGETSGDILAFLPGAGEIRAVGEVLSETLRNRNDSDITVHPLYGDLPFDRQERAILPAATRKIVLATNIAETSLTIEGVRVVIDGGLTRRQAYDPGTGMNRLVTVAVSKAAASQRTGRAGRLGPGICYRLYSENTFQALLPFAPPEISRSDLAELVLDLAHWGVKDPRELSWLDLPPDAHWRAAKELLTILGALDATGFITPLGEAMSRLPLSVRLARLLLNAAELGCPSLGADLAALLSERDILRPGRQEPHGQASVDLSDRLEILRQWRAGKKSAAMADTWALRTVEATAVQLRRLLGKAKDFSAENMAEMIPRLLVVAFPDRIAKRREDDPNRYVMRQGRAVRLSAKNQTGGSPYLIAVVVDQGEKAEGKVHLAQPITEAVLRHALAGQIQIRRQVVWDAREERVVATEEERLGAITLSAKPIHPSSEDVAAVLCEAIRTGAAQVQFSREARQVQARVRLLREIFPQENWPDLSDETLLASPVSWLMPWLSGIRCGRQLAALDLMPALLDLLSRQHRRWLSDRAPVAIVVPSGSSIPIDYTAGEIPVLAVKLQEMFGLADTPAIAGGRIQLLLHLLSPARRPVQITRDLKAFWRSGYPQVKKELQGRYPKHPWPDDPESAEPTRKTKNRA